jgi:hypothetical protein
MRRRRPLAGHALLLGIALLAGFSAVAVGAENAAAEPEASPAAPRDPRAAEAPLDWRQIGRDARYVFGRPAHLDTAGWVRLGAGVGAGASLYLVRDEARDFVLDHGGERWDGVLDDARIMGRLATPLVAAGGFYLAGLARHSARDRETAVVLMESLAFSSAIAATANYVVAAERPEDGDDVNFFAKDGHSVSLDVTIAASMLAPILDRHLRVLPVDRGSVRFWMRFGAWGLYGTAGLVALQRLNEDAHWLPDVYFGYLNGLCVGRMVVDARRGGREDREREPPRRVTMRPAPGGVRLLF